MAVQLCNPATRAGALGCIGGSSVAGHLLNSAVVWGTSGAALGYRFLAKSTTSISNVYFFVTAKAGIATGNVNVDLRTAASSTLPTTGSTIASVVGTYTSAPTKWGVATGWSGANVTVNTAYWLTFSNGNSGAEGSDTVTIHYEGGIIGLDGASGPLIISRAYTSANGFSTSTARNNPPAIVIEFADGTVHGASPYTTTTTGFTNNKLEHALYLPPREVDIEYDAIHFGSVTNLTNIAIYTSDQAPGGTTVLADAISTAAGAPGESFSHAFSTPFRRKAGKAYYVAVKGTGTNNTSPGTYQMQDDSATNYATIIKAGFEGGAAYAAQDVSGAWAVLGTSGATPSHFPRMWLQEKQTDARYLMRGL